MSRKALPVWCDITCCKCGITAGEDYRKGTIGRLRKQTKGWVFSEDYAGILCDSCKKEVRKHK